MRPCALPSTLIPATLARRYKRFLADVVLENGDMLTVHVANPGAMTGLDRPFSRVWLSNSENPMRKLPFNWELVEADFGNGAELVGVNTSHPNVLVAEVIETGLIPQLRDYASVRREVKYGVNSRFDFLLEDPRRPPCYLEVKNVHLMRKPGLAEFPDSVTARGAKHLDELAAAVRGGARAVLLFVIQIPSAERFTVARDIDPAYAAAFDRARAAGVEMLAWRCAITVDGIEIAGAGSDRDRLAAASGLLALAARMLTLRANSHGHFLSTRHDLCRRGLRAAPQDRPDQDPRRRRVRRHAQGRPAGGRVPRHAGAGDQTRRLDRAHRPAGLRVRLWITAPCRRR